jgi:hypothetical protein
MHHYDSEDLYHFDIRHPSQREIDVGIELKQGLSLTAEVRRLRAASMAMQQEDGAIKEAKERYFKACIKHLGSIRRQPMDSDGLCN